MKLRSARSFVLGAVSFLAPATLIAQQAPAPTVVTPSFDFSGVLFGNFGYRFDSLSKANTGGAHPNQFTIDRAYLNFRMPAGDNGAIRITTDVFQNTNTAQNGYYQGWAIRLKYGYLQYAGLTNATGAGSSLLGRIGMLQTVVVDYEEGFWPRYLSQTAPERNGFFSSSDVGVAGLWTLGNRWGEVYGTITNGSNYTSYDKDRFKDVALRATLTPFASHQNMNAIVRTFGITPWFYKGWIGSAFATGGPEQIGPGTNGAITEGLAHDRYGVFAGVRERRLTAAVEWAQRTDGGERGANTAVSPRVVSDSTGRLLDGFIIARPLEWIDASHRSNLGIIARFDHFTPNDSPSAATYAGTTPAYDYWVLGASYDLNQRLTLALDWQKQTGAGFPPPTGTNVRATPEASTLFLHFQATF